MLGDGQAGRAEDRASDQAGIEIQNLSQRHPVEIDGTGLYQKLPIFHQVKEKSFAKVNSIIVVTPSVVGLCGEDAEAIVRNTVANLPGLLDPPEGNTAFGEMLKQLGRDLEAYKQKYEFRTYLMPSVELQRDLLSQVRSGASCAAVCEKLLRLDYPRFVWITEVSQAALLKPMAKEERQCLGRFIIDATAPKNSKSIIAMHFLELLLIYDRQGICEPDRDLVEDTVPFNHKLIAR